MSMPSLRDLCPDFIRGYEYVIPSGFFPDFIRGYGDFIPSGFGLVFYEFVVFGLGDALAGYCYL